MCIFRRIDRFSHLIDFSDLITIKFQQKVEKSTSQSLFTFYRWFVSEKIWNFFVFIFLLYLARENFSLFPFSIISIIVAVFAQIFNFLIAFFLVWLHNNRYILDSLLAARWNYFIPLFLSAQLFLSFFPLMRPNIDWIAETVLTQLFVCFCFSSFFRRFSLSLCAFFNVHRCTMICKQHNRSALGIIKFRFNQFGSKSSTRKLNFPFCEMKIRQVNGLCRVSRFPNFQVEIFILNKCEREISSRFVSPWSRPSPHFFILRAFAYVPNPRKLSGEKQISIYSHELFICSSSSSSWQWAQQIRDKNAQ